MTPENIPKNAFRCPECLSLNVTLVAYLRFDIPSQSWKHSSDDGEYHCCACHLEYVNVEEVPLNDAIQDLKIAVMHLRDWAEGVINVDVDDENDMRRLRDRMISEITVLETYL